jgi:hypothetical protein
MVKGSSSSLRLFYQRWEEKAIVESGGISIPLLVRDIASSDEMTKGANKWQAKRIVRVVARRSPMPVGDWSCHQVFVVNDVPNGQCDACKRG